MHPTSNSGTDVVKHLFSFIVAAFVLAGAHAPSTHRRDG